MKYKGMNYEELKKHIENVIQPQYDKDMKHAYDHTGPNGEPDVLGFQEKAEAASAPLIEAKSALKEMTKREDIEMEPHDDLGDLMTIEDFIENCKQGWFIDYDGYGYYATSTEQTEMSVSPSDIKSGSYRKDFTHIMWYNR